MSFKPPNSGSIKSVKLVIGKTTQHCFFMQTLIHLFLKIEANYANANCTILANGCIQGHEVCDTFPKNGVPANMYTPQINV